MDQLRDNVVRTVNRARLQAVQLHGSETPEDTAWIKQHVRYVIKGFVGGSPSLFNAKDWGADIILVDSPEPGSGKIFDWRQAENVPPGLRVLLAGGLTPENVGDAVQRVKPWGVDVSTGVESSPGKKDLSAVKHFVAAAKSAGKSVDIQGGDESNVENVAGTPNITQPEAQNPDLQRPTLFDWEKDLS